MVDLKDLKAKRAAMEPECPGPDCLMCNGAACNLCGAGCWNNTAPFCEHGSDERHCEPDFRIHLARYEHGRQKIKP